MRAMPTRPGSYSTAGPENELRAPGAGVRGPSSSWSVRGIGTRHRRGFGGRNVPGVAGHTIDTDRLTLRQFTLDDVDALAELHAEPTFWHYPLRRGHSFEEARAWLERTVDRYETDGFAMLAATEKQQARLIGWLGLSVPHWLPEVLPAVEVGWRLGQQWWGQRYATEGAAACIDDGFDRLGLDEIVSIYEPANIPSGAVMDRLGLVHRATTRAGDRNLELSIRALTHDQWQAIRASGDWPRKATPAE